MALRWLLPLLLPGLVFAGWWLTTEGLGLVSPLVLPSPSSVMMALKDTVLEGYREHPLSYHVWNSLRRLALGFSLAALVGVPAGLWLGRHPRARAVTYPLIELVRPLPPLGYYALLVLWFGIYETSKVVLLFMAAFPPIVLATLDAVDTTPVAWVQAGRAMGMSERQLYRYVFFPAALPGVFTGLRVGLGFAFSTLVAAEMVAANAGLGWMVLDASRYLRQEVIFMGNGLLAVTALCLDRGMLALRRRLVPWAFKEAPELSRPQ